MSNPLNNGTVIGRLAADVRVFNNQDGSKRVVFTVYADRNFRNVRGETGSDAIPVETFVRKDTDFNTTPFSMIHRGDLVALDTSLRMANYTNRADERVHALKVNIEGIKLLESKSVTQARLAQRATEAEQANRQMQAQPPAAEAVPAQVAPQPAMHDQPPFGN